MGFGLPVQTAVSSRLRRAADSLLFASLIKFAAGTVFLWALLLITGSLGALAAAGSAGTSWWMWCGGALGFVFLTANILLFPQLGSVETAIWPVAGQIPMDLAVDAGGGSARRGGASRSFGGWGLSWSSAACWEAPTSASRASSCRSSARGRRRCSLSSGR